MATSAAMAELPVKTIKTIKQKEGMTRCKR